MVFDQRFGQQHRPSTRSLRAKYEEPSPRSRAGVNAEEPSGANAEERRPSTASRHVEATANGTAKTDEPLTGVKADEPSQFVSVSGLAVTPTTAMPHVAAESSTSSC